MKRLNKHLVIVLLIGLLALPVASISHPIFHPVAVKADVSTIVHNAFTQHGGRKVGTADDMGVKGPIYEVIRNGQKIDWDSNDMSFKINGKNSSEDTMSIVKQVDSSNQYDNSSSNKSSKPNVNNQVKNKPKPVNKNKDKATKQHKSKTDSNNISKSNNSSKPAKDTTKKSTHKKMGLIASVVVIIIVILGIIGGISHHNKERHY